VLRLLEVALFLMPFMGFGLWWVLAANGGPSPVAVGLAAGAVLLLAAALLWFAQRDTLGMGQRYVPARVEDGRVVPGHAAPQ
jgi:hypothetical protein